MLADWRLRVKPACLAAAIALHRKSGSAHWFGDDRGARL